MKAVVLAAGKGSRISDVTKKDQPKGLLPLGERTLIGHSLDLFEKQGIDNLIVVTGYQRHQIMDYVRGVWKGRVEFVYNPHFDRTNVLYSFWLSLPYLNNSDFIFLHADTVFEESVLKALLDSPDSNDTVFAVDRHPCEEEEMKVQIEDGLVALVTKEMPSDSADGEFLGLARLSGKTIESIRSEAEKLFEAGKMQAFFELAVQQLIEQGKMTVHVADVTGSRWREVDFPEDYRAAKQMLG